MSDSSLTPIVVHDPVESDNVPAGPTFLVLLVTVLAVVGIIAGVVQYYQFAYNDKLNESMGKMDTRRRELEADQTRRLTSYQWVDKAANVVRIPVTDALALTLNDWKNRPVGFTQDPAEAPVVPVVPAVAPDGTPAPVPAPLPEHK